MQRAIEALRQDLRSKPLFFKQVYEFTFNFALPQTGQRSLGLEEDKGDARGYWRSLIPLGLSGGALSHVSSDEDEGDAMESDEEGWKEEYTEWWIEFLEQSGAKGVSSDTWNMVSSSVNLLD